MSCPSPSTYLLSIDQIFLNKWEFPIRWRVSLVVNIAISVKAFCITQRILRVHASHLFSVANYIIAWSIVIFASHEERFTLNRCLIIKEKYVLRQYLYSTSRFPISYRFSLEKTIYFIFCILQISKSIT